MSQVLDLIGLAKALQQATAYVGAAPDSWREAGGPSRAMQGELLARLPQMIRDIERIPELRAWARRTAEEINAILEKEGFEIRLRPWADDGRYFGVASILDLTVEWSEKGTRTEMNVVREGRPQTYPGFLLADGIDYLDVGEPKPLLRIPTRTGDRVYFYQTPDEPSGFELYDQVTALIASRHPSQRFAHFGSTTIPQVKIRREVDIAWIIDLAVPEHELQITQAKQEVRFGLNEIGARAKTATALGLRSKSFSPHPPEPYVIDSPFLIWIERPEIATPLFVAYVTEEDWKEPGSLADI